MSEKEKQFFIKLEGNKSKSDWWDKNKSLINKRTVKRYSPTQSSDSLELNPESSEQSGLSNNGKIVYPSSSVKVNWTNNQPVGRRVSVYHDFPIESIESDYSSESEPEDNNEPESDYSKADYL